jgi:transcriptional regulator with XRE-family HTH domain
VIHTVSHDPDAVKSDPHSPLNGAYGAGVGEFENRIRAARAYAEDMSQKELAQRLGLSEPSVKRLEARTRDLDAHEARFYAERIAAICGLPVGFFFNGFDRLDDTWTPPKDDLAELRQSVQRLGQQFDRLLAAQQQTLAQIDQRVDVNQFAQAVDLLRRTIDTLAQRSATPSGRKAA